MRALTLQDFLHSMVERGITRNNFGKCFALAVIVFDYENFCAHTKPNAEARKLVSERTVVSVRSGAVLLRKSWPRFSLRMLHVQAGFVPRSRS